MSDAIAGVGAQFKREDDDTSGLYVAIAEVRTIGGPEPDMETIDVTNLDSTDGWREKIPGFKDGGQMSLMVNFTRAGYELLFNDFNDRTLQNFELVLPDTDATTFSFAGFIKSLPLDISPDDAITYDVTVEISGAVTLES